MNRPEVQNKPASKIPSKQGMRHTNSQKGISRIIKANKRAEAEARNAKTLAHRRKGFNRALVA